MIYNMFYELSARIISYLFSKGKSSSQQIADHAGKDLVKIIGILLHIIDITGE